MRTGRKLIMRCAIALAAMAYAASSASAAETAVEIERESLPIQCDLAICKVLWQGESHHTRTFDGVEISKCKDTLEAGFSHTEDANRQIGHIYRWTPVNHEVIGPGCNVAPCVNVAEQEWDITNVGEVASSAGHFTLRFCYRPTGTTDTHCNLEFQFSELTFHRHQLSTNGLCGFGLRRIEGAWTQIVDGEHPAIEIDHTPGT